MNQHIAFTPEMNTVLLFTHPKHVLSMQQILLAETRQGHQSATTNFILHKCWCLENALPSTLRSSPTHSAFKRGLKRFDLSAYLSEVHLPYSCVFLLILCVSCTVCTCRCFYCDVPVKVTRPAPLLIFLKLNIYIYIYCWKLSLL